LKKLIIFLVLIVSITACKPGRNHQNIGDSIVTSDTLKVEQLQVAYLSNWELKENSDLGNNSRMLLWERKGSDASGQFIVVIMESELGLDTVLRLMKKEFYMELHKDTSQIVESKVKSIQFNGENALEQKYTYDNTGFIIRGRFVVFRKYQKTYILLFQTFYNDQKENEIGFEFFEKNLKIL
jgi:hypothetical protein